MEYSFHDKLVLRTPLKGMKSAFTIDEIKLFFQKEEIREALFLASPDLCLEYDRWLSGKVTDPVKKKKLISSLLKYAKRMHNRCTPFGLFASCSVVNWAEGDSQIELKANQLYRSTRLDMHFSCQIAQKLAEAPYIKPYLAFYPSTSVYAVNDKLRYIEYGYENKRRVYQISAVDRTEYIDHILVQAKNGAKLHQLAQSLPKLDADISLEEATDFIDQLVAAQLLISEIEPSVSGDELLEQILSVLERLEKEEENQEELIATKTFLLEIKSDLETIDKAIFNDKDVYHKLAEKLEEMDIPYELSKLFQTDLFIKNNPKNGLDSNLQGQLKKVIRVLNRLTKYRKNQNVKDFEEKFYARFEEAEVPLVTVLDNEAGIGYAQNTNHTGDYSPLVNDLMLSGKGSNEDQKLEWSSEDSFLHGKLIEALKEGEQVISLTEKDFKDLTENWDDLPDSLSVMFSHLGKKLLLKSVSGSSGINLFGRFASGSDEIKDIILDIEKSERVLHENEILAEIVHLPESRTGNILMRPSFRPYEIPYLSKSDLPKENQISVADLYVSMVNQKLVLRSKKHGKQVHPRLGNAHNYSAHSLPVYHFLSDFQTYGKRGGLYFHWGPLQNEHQFLPRVEIEGVIVSEATWNFDKKDIESLQKEEFKTNINGWQAKHKLPDLILFCEGDNELLVNLKNELSVSLFLDTIKKKSAIVIKEFLFDSDSSIVKNEQGQGFTNQFVATLVKRNPAKEPSRTSASSDAEVPISSEGIFEKDADKAPEKNKEKDVEVQTRDAEVQTKDVEVQTKDVEVQTRDAEVQTKDAEVQTRDAEALEAPLAQRNFSVGSEWLYYKLYGGTKTADEVLSEIIKPLVESWLEKKYIDRWFFIRYSDPDTHLRVRFHFSDFTHLGSVLSEFNEALQETLASGLLWRMQLDTYRREMERYGPGAIEIAERIFFHDSHNIADVLSMIEHDGEGEKYRWLYALRAVDQFLIDFNRTLEQRKEIMEGLRNGFGQEFGMNKHLNKQIDKKFRADKTAIEQVLDRSKDAEHEMLPLFEALYQKSALIKPEIEALLNLDAEQKLGVHVQDLICSYIHMLLNRLFKNKQRLHELVIYDFLWKKYRSDFARAKNEKR